MHGAVRAAVAGTAVVALAIAAGCGGSDGQGTTASTPTSPAPAERLTGDVYAALRADRAKLGGRTKPCEGEIPAVGKCVAGQFATLLGSVNVYLRDLKAAQPVVSGTCRTAIDNSVTFQTAQSARMRRIISVGRTTRTPERFEVLSGLLKANTAAAQANDAARKQAPEGDWEVSCAPA